MLPHDSERVRPAMLEAFERELTTDLVRRLLEFATRRVAMLHAAGIAGVADEAAFLVREAIADALGARSIWRAGVVPLDQYLRGVIRRRTWAQLARMRRRWSNPPKASSADERIGEADGHEPHQAALPDPRWAASERIRLVLAGLDERSGDDAAVRLLLHAYCAGAVTRQDVMQRCGLTAHDYATARRRLDRLLAAVPEPTCVSALQAQWRLP